MIINTVIAANEAAKNISLVIEFAPDNTKVFHALRFCVETMIRLRAYLARVTSGEAHKNLQHLEAWNASDRLRV